MYLSTLPFSLRVFILYKHETYSYTYWYYQDKFKIIILHNNIIKGVSIFKITSLPRYTINVENSLICMILIWVNKIVSIKLKYFNEFINKTVWIDFTFNKTWITSRQICRGLLLYVVWMYLTYHMYKNASCFFISIFLHTR